MNIVQIVQEVLENTGKLVRTKVMFSNYNPI